MKSVIISGALAQDHEFIYPFYRVLEEGFELDVCLLEGKPVKGNFYVKGKRIVYSLYGRIFIKNKRI